MTTLHFVPPMLEHFIAEPEVKRCVTLKRLFAGGEALSAELKGRVLAAFPRVRFDNHYGPTEALIDATFWNCRDDGAARVPIGRPIPGTAIRILDAGLKLGSGRGDGRIVHRRRRACARLLAASRADGGAVRPGSVRQLRRSGCIGRGIWCAGGRTAPSNIVGRSDHQIKIRGFRIELGEIEARLLGQPGVRSAVVIAREPGVARRCSVMFAGRTNLTGRFCAQRCRLACRITWCRRVSLTLERLPLTPNGKVDRRALPDAGGDGYRLGAPGAAYPGGSGARGDLGRIARPACRRPRRQFFRTRRRFDHLAANGEPRPTRRLPDRTARCVPASDLEALALAARAERRV